MIEIPENSFDTKIQIRFIDTDQAGHVNNATAVTFLEVARVEWIKQEAKRSSMSQVPIIIARVEIDYLAPIMLYSEPIVSMWISRMGTKSFDMDYVIHGFENDQKIIFATAKTVIVYYDYDNQVSTPIPTEVRELFQKYMPKTNS